MIRLCGQPAVRSRSNEELLDEGMAATHGLLEELEGLLHAPQPRVQIETAKALREIALGNDPLRPNAGATIFVLGAGDVRPDCARARATSRRACCSRRASTSSRLASWVQALHEKDNLVQHAPDPHPPGSDDADAPARPAARRRQARPRPPGAGDGGAPSPGGGSPGSPSSHRPSRVGGFGGVLTFSTLPRQLAHAESVLLLALMKLLLELSCDEASSAALVREGAMGVIVSVLQLLLGEPQHPVVAIAIEVPRSETRARGPTARGQRDRARL